MQMRENEKDCVEFTHSIYTNPEYNHQAHLNESIDSLKANFLLKFCIKVVELDDIKGKVLEAILTLL